MSGPIDVVESQVVFRGRLLEVVVDRVRFPDGRETTWESVHHPGAAAVVPVASDGRVILVRQTNDGPGLVMKVDVGAIGRLGAAGTNYQLAPGDRIYVGSRHLLDMLF